MSTSIRLGDAEVPRIGLGTNRLSYTDDHVAFIRDAIVAGIGHIDTAHLYAGGDSETTIGAAKLEAIVGTKGGYAPGEGRPAIHDDRPGPGARLCHRLPGHQQPADVK